MGYSDLQKFIDNLTERGYQIESQARLSPLLLKFTDRGIFPAYHEKSQSGLQILSSDGQVLFSASYPERIYKTFDSIPELVVKTLLFIENRELLDPRYPYRNPAVEWDRFAKAVFDAALHTIYKGHKTTGGSTIATQLEKYRHSPEGRTSTGSEKIRQMVSAALRSYLDGEQTWVSRKQILLDYINSIPLAALPGYGEVNGLGDGLWAWYGSDFNTVNNYLSNNQDTEARALAYKQVLSLFLAHRRPSFYLIENRDALKSLTNRYIVMLAKAGIIPPTMRNLALRAELKIREDADIQRDISFLERKAANSVRTNLCTLLDVPNLYDLDRLDLTVKSTIDQPTQQAVAEVLQKLNDPDYASRLGLVGHRLLEQGRSSKVIYSFMLYERVNNANLLRVQADSFDQPLNINEGVKLELGSTAKLRTLITYLEIIAELHKRYSGLSPEELQSIRIPSADRLSQWVISYLSRADDKSLKAILKAAMERQYSGSSDESFFTGGGLHTFANFEGKGGGMVSVRKALEESINLAFIRIMRDIVNYYTYQVPGSTAKILEDAGDPRRKVYLSRFADKEGRIFLNRFYRKYEGKSPQEMLDILVQRVRPTPARLAVIFRSVKPEASLEEFAEFMRSRLNSTIDYDDIKALYEKYSKSKFNLADRGYIARVHPLELWVVEYLIHHPSAGWDEITKDSADERQAVYAWLFKTSRKHAQDIRIRTLIEAEAFQEIHRSWKRLGYPFDFLVPSYATAIGSSGDRPAALAELVGIVLNNGVRYPSLRMEELHFAKGTPYETNLRYRQNAGEQVLLPEIAEVVKDALIGVVERGTAKRLHKVFRRSDGNYIVVGGKTGTGDNRRDIYGPGGRLIGSRVINRTATFVFLIGDRFFGTITAYVDGPESAQYKFTSSLPVQLLKILAPTLMPVIEGKSISPTINIVARSPIRTRPDVKSEIEQRDASADKEPIPVLPSDQAKKLAKYTVKVGTFISRENAEDLVRSLESSGYKPWLKPESLAGETVFHVLVGTFDDADKAREFGSSLKEKSPSVTDFMIREIQP